jgi:hypothetical protein
VTVARTLTHTDTLDVCGLGDRLRKKTTLTLKRRSAFVGRRAFTSTRSISPKNLSSTNGPAHARATPPSIPVALGRTEALVAACVGLGAWGGQCFESKRRGGFLGPPRGARTRCLLCCAWDARAVGRYLKIQLEDVNDYEAALTYISKLPVDEVGSAVPPLPLVPASKGAPLCMWVCVCAWRSFAAWGGGVGQAEKNLKQYGKTLVNNLPELTTALLKRLCAEGGPVSAGACTHVWTSQAVGLSEERCDGTGTATATAAAKALGDDAAEALRRRRPRPEDLMHIFVNQQAYLTQFLEHMVHAPTSTPTPTPTHPHPHTHARTYTYISLYRFPYVCLTRQGGFAGAADDGCVARAIQHTPRAVSEAGTASSSLSSHYSNAHGLTASLSLCVSVCLYLSLSLCVLARRRTARRQLPWRPPERRRPRCRPRPTEPRCALREHWHVCAYLLVGLSVCVFVRACSRRLRPRRRHSIATAPWSCCASRTPILTGTTPSCCASCTIFAAACSFSTSATACRRQPPPSAATPHMHTHTDTDTRRETHMDTHTDTHPPTHTYTLTHTHTHTRTHTHRHMRCA